MKWREVAAPIIEKVIAEHKDNPEALKKALFDVYPFQERAHHPYKIWLDEIKRQTGKKPPLKKPGRKAAPVDKKQLKLF